MGRVVFCGDLNDSKQDLAPATLPASPTTPAPGAMYVWVGDNFLKQNLVATTSLQRCQDTIREEGFPDPASGSEVAAVLRGGAAKSEVVFTNQATFPTTITEDDVVVAYAAGFADGASTKLYDDAITRAIEVYLEDRKAA